MKLTVKIRWAVLFCIGSSLLFLTKLFNGQSVIDEDYSFSIDESDDERFVKGHLRMPDTLIGRKLNFDQVYETRKVKLLNKTKTSPSNGTKVIVVWTPWNSLKGTINYYFPRSGKRLFTRYKCPVDDCIITRKRKASRYADVVLFHLIDTDPDDLPPSPRPANQLWVMYNLEAPWLVRRHVPKPHLLFNLFNLTMSYREDSAIIVKYGFIEATNKSLPNSHWNDVYRNKTRSVVWFVSDCDTDSKREDYVKELQNYIDVDIYGLCGDKKCFPSQSKTCYGNILTKYKYYLSFENSICRDYVTEKFFNVFNFDIVPVVFGGATYSNIAPDGTYIDATDYPRPKDLAQVLLKTGSDPIAYNRILRKKASYESYLHPWMCNLCERLHEPVTQPPLGDVNHWWIKEARCLRWNKTLGYFRLKY